MIKVNDDYDKIEALKEIEQKYPKLFRRYKSVLWCIYLNQPLREEIMFGELIELFLFPPKECHFEMIHNTTIDIFRTDLDHIDESFYHTLFEYGITVKNDNPGINIQSIYRQWTISNIINDQETDT